MRELIEPLHRRVQRELRLENDTSLQMGSKEAVAGNAELLRQVCMNMRDGLHGGPSCFKACFETATDFSCVLPRLPDAHVRLIPGNRAQF